MQVFHKVDIKIEEKKREKSFQFLITKQIEEAGNCPNDYVAEIEGSFGSTDVIRRLCGSNQLPSNQSTIISSSNSLLVHMHTDSVNGNRGFVADHEGRNTF